MSDHANKIVALETSQNEVKDRLVELEAQCAALAADNVKLRATVDDQENHSHRRVTGLPAGEEGTNPTTFM